MITFIVTIYNYILLPKACFGASLQQETVRINIKLEKRKR